MKAALMHKTFQNLLHNLQMQCGSRCLRAIIFTCHCLICLQFRDKLDVKCSTSQQGVTSTCSRMESDPFTKAHLRESATSAKRGEIQKTYSRKRSRFSHPTPFPLTPPRQAVGRKHSNCLWSRKELLPCFLELSHDWDSSHISTRVFALT